MPSCQLTSHENFCDMQVISTPREAHLKLWTHTHARTRARLHGAKYSMEMEERQRVKQKDKQTAR